MFNFSANHLLLLSRMEYRTCAVLLMRDDSTRRVYRLHDFSKSQTPTPGQYYCVSGKVNSADKLYLVIESIKPDTKHSRCSSSCSCRRRGRIVHGLTLPAWKKLGPWLLGIPAAGAGVCPPAPTAAFGRTKTGQSGAILFRR